MPRKKKISDKSVLEAAIRVMGRLGPEKFTLSSVAQESGIAAATLVQRFGSKRDMLLAIAESAPKDIAAFFDSVLKSEPVSPLTTLLDLFAQSARTLGKPDELANNLAFLHIDLTDPDFRKHTVAHFEEMEKGIKRLLWAAAKAGEIEEAKGTPLARSVMTAYQGAMIYWCVFREGDIGDFVREQIAAVLTPYSPARYS